MCQIFQKIVVINPLSITYIQRSRNHQGRGKLAVRVSDFYTKLISMLMKPLSVESKHGFNWSLDKGMSSLLLPVDLSPSLITRVIYSRGCYSRH